MIQQPPVNVMWGQHYQRRTKSKDPLGALDRDKLGSLNIS